MRVYMVGAKNVHHGLWLASIVTTSTARNLEVLTRLMLLKPFMAPIIDYHRLYSTLLYATILYCTVLYYTVVYYRLIKKDHLDLEAAYWSGQRDPSIG